MPKGSVCGEPDQCCTCAIVGATRATNPLVLSDGRDYDLTRGWTSLRDEANANSIAIFALRPDTVKDHWEPRNYGAYGRAFAPPEAPLSDLCRSTGGLLLAASADDVGIELARIVSWLRARYILEFPRPANGAAGIHALDIKTTNPSDLIRSSGVLFPTRASSREKDLHLVPVAPPTPSHEKKR